MMQHHACYAVLSPGIWRIPWLHELLGAELEFCTGLRAPRRASAVLGWGQRRTARRSRAFARRHGLPFVALEDGFLRSLGLGRDDPPLSLVIDDEGIHYDARNPSRLDRLLAVTLDARQVARALELIVVWRRERVSKYNHQRDPEGGALPERFVLAVDQTYGDASVVGGLADRQSFTRMLRAALDENPGCTVVVKTHPDVFAGKARGWLDATALDPRVLVLAQDVHPAALLERAEAVYVVSSQLGFEALLHGVPVHTFGMPFYAGRGLSRDALPAPAWRQPVTLAQLVHAALVAYPRYRDPESGTACEVETVLEHLGLQRRMRARFAPQACAAGFSLWKRPLVRRFAQGTALHFVRSADAAPPGAQLLVWGRADPASAAGHEIVRLEDGFLRSVGLGADLVTPLSWVMDRSGLYYDAGCSSDLEELLQHAEFDAVLRARAAALRERIVAARLSKYNLGGSGWQRPPGRRQVILVPGQVETDAAVALGARGIHSNLELLRAVRTMRPDAWIVYKPHPDVVAGLRDGGAAARQLLPLCNEIVVDCAIAALLEAVDEVHVLSSLAGFEALLRQCPVICHGQPFYAGWGLTQDLIPLARRSRRLVLDELVAGVLLLYPSYVSRRSGRFTTAERALDELIEWREHVDHVPRVGLLRPLLRLRARLLGL